LGKGQAEEDVEKTISKINFKQR
jgi:hypothetical protein